MLGLVSVTAPSELRLSFVPDLSSFDIKLAKASHFRVQRAATFAIKQKQLTSLGILSIWPYRQ